MYVWAMPSVAAWLCACARVCVCLLMHSSVGVLCPLSCPVFQAQLGQCHMRHVPASACLHGRLGLHGDRKLGVALFSVMNVYALLNWGGQNCACIHHLLSCVPCVCVCMSLCVCVCVCVCVSAGLCVLCVAVHCDPNPISS